jgi:two-component system, HptB-dependent secretion and biofilm response regulator
MTGSRNPGEHSSSGAQDRVALDADAALRECQQRLTTLHRLSSQFFWETDAQHRLTWLVGGSIISSASAADHQIGKTHWELPSTRPDELGWQAHRAVLDQHLTFRDFEFARMAPDGDERQYCISGEPRVSPEGEFLGYRGVGQDITEWRRAEFELRQFRTVIDTTADGIHIVDRETMRLIDANDTACRKLGYTREEFLRLGIGDFAPNFDPVKLAVRYDRLFSGEDLEQSAEIVHRHKNGSEIPIEIHRRGVVINGRRIVVNIVHDISARKLAERAMRESEERFQLVVQGTDDGIWDWNIVTGYCYYSPRYRLLLGCSDDELQPTRDAFQSRLHPDDRAGTLAAVHAHFEQRLPYDVEYRLLVQSGDYRWFHARGQASWDAHGKPIRLAGALRDITERKQAALDLAAANQALEEYQAIEEEEKRVAKHLLDQLVRIDPNLSDRVSYWILPARYFSGDIVAVARTPDDTLHLLLADGTGHGLSAALGALPSVQPFYAMSEKGFSISAIAREMNAKVRALLPTGRFIAATLASIDSVAGIIRIWNGGNPSCHLVDEQGDLVRRFGSRHMALGILDDAQFDAQVETCACETNCQLIMVSDGLVEARNADGQVFGEERLTALAAEALPRVRMRALRSAVHGHLHYQEPGDDISLVIAACSRSSAPPALPPMYEHSPESEPQINSRMELVLGVEQLKDSDVVPELCSLFKQLGLIGANHSTTFVVLRELIDNALDHGLLGLESALEDAGDEHEAYLTERARRLARLEHGSIQIQSERISAPGGSFLRLVVKHSGKASDLERYLGAGTPRPGADRRGRGIAIMRSLCTRLEYRDGWREVEAHIPLASRV